MTKSQAARRDELAIECMNEYNKLRDLGDHNLFDPVFAGYCYGYDAAIKDAEVLVGALNYAKGQIVGLTEGLANEMCERSEPRTAYIDKTLAKWRGEG